MNNDESTQFQSKMLLKKPLKSYEVGEQKKLNYELPVDFKNFRFGKSSQASEFGVNACMNQNLENEKYSKSISKTKLVNNQTSSQKQLFNKNAK